MPDLRKLKDRAAELLARGKPDKAVDAYRAVTAADPRDLAAHQRFAEALRKAGRDAEALIAFRNVADRYARDGFLIKAIAVCKVVLEIDPGHEATQAMLADLYARKQGAAPVLRAAREEPAEVVVELRLDPEPASPPVGGAPAPARPGRLPQVSELPPELDPSLVDPDEETTAFEVILEAAREGAEAGTEPDPPHAPEPGLEAPAAPPGAPRPALPRIPLFSDLSREAFLALTERVALRRVRRGEAVLREGEDGASFFVVASGRFRVEKRGASTSPVLLARLGEGAYFGEMALLSGAPRSASVVAEEDGEVLEIRAEALAELCRRHPHVAESLKRFYRQRLLATAMATSPLFRPFDRAERRRLMERFHTRRVRPRERILVEGRPSDGLYVVLSGSLDVLKRKGGADALVGRLAEGDVFGEMSCLSKRPATATVTARRPGIVLRLPREEFDEMVTSYPQILELVSELSDERAMSLDAILSGYAAFTEDGLVLL